jgi:tyrosyl-tRNA synthetase
VQYVILPVAALRGTEFRVERDSAQLGPLSYVSIDSIHEDYRNDVVRLFNRASETIVC